jgi:hypothetical protein
MKPALGESCIAMDGLKPTLSLVNNINEMRNVRANSHLQLLSTSR